MDQQQVNKSILESAIKECNETLVKWTETRKDFLITEAEIKGVLYNRIKKYAGNWREQKDLLKSLRIQIKDRQVNTITAISTNSYIKDRTIILFNNYFETIDYESLKFNMPSNLSINTINFNTIENIKF